MRNPVTVIDRKKVRKSMKNSNGNGKNKSKRKEIETNYMEISHQETIMLIDYNLFSNCIHVCK